MSSFSLPSVASMATSSYLTRTTGARVSAEEVAKVVARLREAQPKLTDKASCALLVISHSPNGIGFKDIEAALGVKQGVLRVVLGALFDLGLISAGSGDAPDWVRIVSITDAGRLLVAEASQ